MALNVRTALLLPAVLALAACAGPDVQEDGLVVKTAKACQRAKESNPGVLEGFKINACTSTGVWMVDQYDENGVLLKRFDFLNREYAGPESNGVFVPVALLGLDAPARLQTVRQTLNTKLLEPKS